MDAVGNGAGGMELLVGACSGGAVGEVEGTEVDEVVRGDLDDGRAEKGEEEV